MGNDNEGGVIKSEDPGETLEEAGLSEETDGSADATDEKDNDAESNEAGESGDDAGTEKARKLMEIGQNMMKRVNRLKAKGLPR